ncbi:MAG: transporter [Cyanobacteria bacterium SZAS TMP-1]|nr:transporter [Cyanobacteria bacterium SZAS TMP-1]
MLAGPTSGAAVAIDTTAAIETNRPSFMASPLVVPRGSLQLENGTLFSGLRHGQWSYDLPKTEVRIGALKNTELQMFVPDFFLMRDNNSTAGRVSNLSEIGIKQHIAVAPKLDMAVIVAVSAPTGSPQINGPGTIPALRAPYIYALNSKWGLGGMQSLLIRDQWRNVEWQPDVLLCRSIGSRSGAFIEYGGSFAQNHNPINLIHFGGVYKISHCQQLDCQFGFGLNESAPSAFVGAGYSVRFDQLHW